MARKRTKDVEVNETSTVETGEVIGVQGGEPDETTEINAVGADHGEFGISESQEDMAAADASGDDVAGGVVDDDCSADGESETGDSEQIQAVDNEDSIGGEAPAEKRDRRANNSGSIYPIYKNGDKSKIYRWGFCLILGKAPDGRRLRHLETANSIEEIEIKLEMAKGRADELRKLHLKKYGFDVEDSGGGGEVAKANEE